VTPKPPVPSPPVTAEYSSELQAAKPNVPPVQSAYRFTRASDGSTRVDSGNTSVISNPAAGQTIVLDHLKKTALVTPTPPPAPQPAAPQMPQSGPPAFPAAPSQPPGIQGQDLGKSILQGHEVDGRKYVIQPPPTPQMPGMPKAPEIPGMPKAPQMPGMPPSPAVAQMPGAPAPPKAPGIPGAPTTPQTPAAPQPPQAPTAVETWTSTKLHVPMLTKMNGPFGQLTQVCHSAVPGEPHPAAFQIPPGYKVTTPAPPKLPTPPKPPAMPKL
jgi:hypothetical protein